MLEMKLEDLFKDEEQIKKCETKIEKEKTDKSYIVDYTTCLGDKVHCEFYSPKKEQYMAVFEKLWEKIGDKYILTNDYLIYLPPNMYWTIYKKALYGKEFLKHTGVRNFQVNGKGYKFPDTNYYFQNLTSPLGTTLRGVYGIYVDEKLLYIGSSSTDMKERWKEHAREFQKKSYGMYTVEGEIVFRSLLLDDEIKELMPRECESISSTTIQFIEAILIKVLQPKGNMAGRLTKFQYNTNLKDEQINDDYIEVIRTLLESDDIVSKEEINEYIKDRFGGEYYQELKS